jgi:hypothetical protein
VTASHLPPAVEIPWGEGTLLSSFGPLREQRCLGKGRVIDWRRLRVISWESWTDAVVPSSMYPGHTAWVCGGVTWSERSLLTGRYLASGGGGSACGPRPWERRS